VVGPGRLGISYGWPMLDDNHHTIGYDNVLRFGLRGLMARAEQRMSSVATEKEREFLTAVVAGCSAMIRVAERMGPRPGG